MFRLALALTGLMLADPRVGNQGATEAARCTIVNTTDSPIVIGLYQPSRSGISEQLINVLPKTELYGVPVAATEDDQFVIAYGAVVEGGVISRVNPLQIHGHKKIRFIADAKDQHSPAVLIQYRGGAHLEPSGKSEFNTALYVAGSQEAADFVLQNANETSRLVPTPLARTKFAGGSSPERAERTDEREPE